MALGFETLELKCCKSKLRELTLARGRSGRPRKGAFRGLRPSFKVISCDLIYIYIYIYTNNDNNNNNNNHNTHSNNSSRSNNNNNNNSNTNTNKIISRVPPRSAAVAGTLWMYFAALKNLSN